MEIRLTPERLTDYRTRTFRLAANLRLTTVEEAIDFVNQRGFVFFWPIKGFLLPSLWVATAGDRPVADEHDDPGHRCWGWKDSLLGKRTWYYARLLRRRNTILSLEIAPYFYALSPNYGDPENDYYDQYRAGQLTLESKILYEALLNHGAMNTIDLKKAAHLSSPSSEARFNHALDALQIEMKILPVGVAEAGSWRYAFIYDLVARHFPDLPSQAASIGENQARQKLVALYFLSVGAARLSDVSRLFNWRTEDTDRAVNTLVEQGLLVNNVNLSDQPGTVYTLADLV